MRVSAGGNTDIVCGQKEPPAKEALERLPELPVTDADLEVPPAAFARAGATAGEPPKQQLSRPIARGSAALRNGGLGAERLCCY